MVEAAGGEHHSVLLMKSGKVYTLGRKVNGPLGRGDVEADKDGGLSKPGVVDGEEKEVGRELVD